MESLSPVNLNIGLLLLCGLFLGRILSHFGLPRVAAYVIAGMVFSPDMLGRFAEIGIGNWAKPLTTGTLGIIAYLIGGSITIKQVQRIGKIIIGTTLGQSLGAVIVVFISILIFAPDIPGISDVQLALIFAVIASTTAPAGTVAVLHQYRVQGAFATALLGVVALDDALGIILFSLMIVVTAGQSLTASIGMAVIEVVGAIVLGGVAGKLLTLFSKQIQKSELRLPLILGVILLVLGLSEILNLSPLLSSMSLGFSSRYFMGAAGDIIFTSVEYLEELVFIIFFTIAGAHFEFHLFLQHFGLIMTYFIARIVGKIIGAFFGARATKAPAPIVCWLGFGLIPQAGVAVGLALTLSQMSVFKEVSSVIVNVIIASTLLYEIVGPFAVKFALVKAGELGLKRERRKY